MLWYISMRCAQLRPLVAVENVCLRSFYIIIENEIFLHRILYAFNSGKEIFVFFRKSSEFASHLV